MNTTARSIVTVLGVLSLTAALVTAFAAATVPGQRAAGLAATAAHVLAGGAGWQ